MKYCVRRSIILISGIALWSLQGCSEKDTRKSITGDSGVDTLIASLYELEERCQSGDEISCAEISKELGPKINNLGWCARDLRQPKGTYTWHRCDAKSFRYADTALTSEPPSQWRYSSEKDEMSDAITSFATVESTNQINFDFPYEGPQKATLWLRHHPRVGRDAILVIEKGQFLCRPDDCNILVRFDEGKASVYSASEPSDGSATYIFISNFSRFYGNLKNSKKIRIEAEFFREGPRILEFDSAGFDESQLAPPNRPPE